VNGEASEFGELRTPLQGALAGGGDPASSPLYVFGPFLVLLAGAGVAPETFGASVWLAVLTILAAALEADRALVVMGTHGHTGLRRAVVGSVTAEVVETATVPVLMVPPGHPVARTRSRAR